jgi:hypothetical protein
MRLNYIYLECDENRRWDLAGRVKSEDVDVSSIIMVNDVPFERLLRHNGQPPPLRRNGNRKRTSTSWSVKPRAEIRAVTQAGGGEHVDCPGSAQGL